MVLVYVHCTNLCYYTQHLSLGTFGQNRPRESTVSTKYRGRPEN